MNNILKKWNPENGWEDMSKNAVLLEKGGMLTTENYRSIYYNLDFPKNSGIVKIMLDIYTENCFRVLLCGTADGRSPIDRQISEMLEKTVLFHLNHLYKEKKMVLEHDTGRVIAEDAETGKNYRMEIILDYNRKDAGREWICLNIVEPFIGHIYTDSLWISGNAEACTDALAQIRIVFKTSPKNHYGKTYLKDFSIDYDVKAEKNRAMIMTAEEIMQECRALVYSPDRMEQDSSVLTIKDAVRSLKLNYSIRGLSAAFPRFRYKDHDIFDERDMEELYDSAERRLLVYPNMGDKLIEEAQKAAKSGMDRGRIIERLLAIIDGTAESAVEDRIEFLEAENAELTVEMEYRISCLELGV